MLVDYHVKYLGSNKRNLYPFAISENKKQAAGIVKNISNWISKLDTKDKISNDEIINFMETLKKPQNILKALYKIEVIII